MRKTRSSNPVRAEEMTEPGEGMDRKTEGPRERTKPEAKRRHRKQRVPETELRRGL